jgi:hypothetical protein
MTNYNNSSKKSYIEGEELAEIPENNYFLQRIENGMGELPIPDYEERMSFYGKDGTVQDFTDAQQDALEEYEQVYYRLMEAGQALIESFGYNAIYGD